MKNVLRLVKMMVTCFVLSFCFSGCVSQQQLRNADYGPRPPAEYQEQIKKAMAPYLKDPYSAVYVFNPLFKRGWMKDGFTEGGTVHYGWLIQTSINAKNSFGGYAGEKTYVFIYYQGRYRDVTGIVDAGAWAGFFDYPWM